MVTTSSELYHGEGSRVVAISLLSERRFQVGERSWALHLALNPALLRVFCCEQY